MSLNLAHLDREVGLIMASHVWTTTVSSQTLVAAASSGKAYTLRYIAVGASAGVGNVHITPNTTAGSVVWYYNQTGPHSEEALIRLEDAEGMYLHAAAGVGSGFIRVYYSVRQTSGTREG